MKFKQGLILLLSILIFIFCSIKIIQSREVENRYADVLLLNIAELKRFRKEIQENKNKYSVLTRTLQYRAEPALEAGPFSVLEKQAIPPSGDKHDYMSLGPYWWPNPATPDGLPYIRRDGEVNPDRSKYDKIPLRTLELTVNELALAYFYTNYERYARHAVELIREWFLNDATKMNPNLNFGQFIPGRSQGRGVGIIEGRSFFRIADAAALLAYSKYWSHSDQNQFKQWLRHYLDWLITSDLGADEAGQENNHGTWYDVQVAYLALYTGAEEIARQVLLAFPEKRIACQVAADGSQPLELVRTRAFSYSLMNLDGYFTAARLGERLGLDLWNQVTENNRSIRMALNYLTDRALQPEDWEYQQISNWDGVYESLRVILRRASIHFREPKYEALIQQLPNAGESDFELLNLIYPKTNF